MNRRNIGLFLASLLVAIALYIQVQPLATTERELEFTAPLELNALPPTLAVLNPPASVRLLATGTPEELRSFDSSNFKAVLNLATAKAGTGRFVVQVNSSSPVNLRVTPRDAQVTLNIEIRTDKKIPVDFETAGNLPNMFTFSGATLAPESVTVTGPESLVNRVDRVRVVFNLALAKPQGAYQVEVEALDKEDRPVPDVMLEPKSVTVSPALASAPVGKVILINLNAVGSPAPGYRIASYTITPNSVGVSGDPTQLAMFTTLETEEVDISGINRSRTIKVKLKVPEGVQPSAEEVTVNIEVERAR
ncbi:MAG: hypothetical protein KF812_04760 [Fimbriimonadaceae bacterium]|nr:hypothetical protein [Fimbriimonadaceae bacterium]